jgi:HEAT repeat protein
MALMTGIALAATAGAPVRRAAAAAPVPAPPGGRTDAAGAAVNLQLTEHPDGKVAIRDGTTTLAEIALATPALRRATPVLRETRVEGHRVVELRVPVRGQPSEEIWIGDAGVQPARLIWSGFTGPRDADGEASLFVEVTAERIFEYQTAAQVSRCDDRPVRLFPRAWDFTAGRFRPILSTAPPLAATRIVARRGDPAMPAGRPLGGFRFVAASTTLAAGADARGLGSPTGLDDGDPKTIWAEGLGGDGRGEFLTARTTGGDARIRGLRIVPGDASSPAAWKAHNRLKALSIALGPDPERQFEVDWPQDPAGTRSSAGVAGAPGEAFWIALPAPVLSSCVTVVIRDVYRGSEAGAHGGGGTTAISDLEVFTDLDETGGVDRLIADTAGRADCAGRVTLLASQGASAVTPLAKALRAATAARSPGRECLLQALARIDATSGDADALAALAGALGGASAADERLATSVFQKAAHPPISALAAELRTGGAGNDTDRSRAARVLGALQSEEASRALLAAVGDGSPDLRLAVVQALGQSAVASVALVSEALDAAARPGTNGAATAARRADLVRVLPGLGRRSPAEAAAALAVLRRTLGDPAGPFEMRARAVMAMGALGTAEVVPDLATMAAHAADPVLRSLAVRELGGLAGAQATVALRAALGDPDPHVREAAADALGLRRAADAEAQLIAGAKQEEWPLVRRAEIEALGRLCGEPARDLLIRAIERDVDDVRRVALVGLARCRDRRARPALLQVVKTRRVNASLRELAAGLLGETRDPVAATVLAKLLPGLVNEAESDMAIEGIATAALRSLGRQGGPLAVKAAADLSRDAHHPYRPTAIEVLGQLCDPTVGAAALADARQGKDPSLAEAAAVAEARCRPHTP